LSKFARIVEQYLKQSDSIAALQKAIRSNDYEMYIKIISSQEYAFPSKDTFASMIENYRNLINAIRKNNYDEFVRIFQTKLNLSTRIIKENSNDNKKIEETPLIK